MLGVVRLIALCLADVSVCEWRSGWLCCLAPCSWFWNFQHATLLMHALCRWARCSLVVPVLPTHLPVFVCREDPFLPHPLVEVDGGFSNLMRVLR